MGMAFDPAPGSGFGDKEIDRIMELAEAVCLMPDPTGEPKRLSHARAKAALSTLQRAAYYRSQGIRTDLVHIMVKKKLRLIAEASTIQDLKAIEAEPKPRYTGNGFTASRFSVPEEELIVWSITSLKAPLIPAGADRYAALFRQVFGYLPETGRAGSEI